MKLLSLIRVETAFLLVSILLGVSDLRILNAHAQPTHQYIVREAYDLLRRQLGDIPVLKDYIGSTEGRGQIGNNVFGFQEGTVVAGTWGEDELDPVFRHYGINGSFVSLSHFWNADGGDPSDKGRENEVKFWLYDVLDDEKLYWLFELGGSPWPDNAWKKMIAYKNGDFSIWFVHDKTLLLFRYSDLIDFAKNGSIELYGKVEASVAFPEPVTMKSALDHLENYGPYSGGIGIRTLIPKVRRSTNIEVELGISYLSVRYGIAFNVLGRMAHLVGDMSVPAHVHNQQHAAPADQFEKRMDIEESNFLSSWDGRSVLALSGGFINPYRYCPTTDPLAGPLFGLLYETNQITDNFASHATNGDAVFVEIGELRDHYDEFGNGQDLLGLPRLGQDYRNNSYKHSGSPPHDGNAIVDCGDGELEFFANIHCMNGPSDTSSIQAIKNTTLPFVIRSTAALLYWFAIECDFVPAQCSSDVSLSNASLSWNYYKFRGKSVAMGVDADVSLPSGERGPVYVSGAKTFADIVASEVVTFLPGFTATSQGGVVLHARIGDCGEIGGCSGSQSGKQVAQDRGVRDSSKYIGRFSVGVLRDVTYSDSGAMRVHPNPVVDRLIVEFEIPAVQSGGTLWVFDSQARVVLQIELRSSEARVRSVAIDVGDLPRGEYIVAISKDQEFLNTQKFVHY